jgi:hypothetical protein
MRLPAGHEHPGYAGLTHRYKVLLLQAPPVHHGRLLVFARTQMGDNTQLIRVRQSAGRHKLTLIVCALLVLAGFVGWLTSL